MIRDAILVSIGLFVGWWFIPQPQWAVDLKAKLFSFFKSGPPSDPAPKA